MRLTKTLYIIQEGEPVYLGDDWRGVPIYGDAPIVYNPFKGEIEPFSSELAKTRLGLFVDVTNRLFCKPNSGITIGTQIAYNDQNVDNFGDYERYTVTECLRYDKHYEVLVKKGGL